MDSAQNSYIATQSNDINSISDDKRLTIALEQYKILITVLLGLSDNFVKGILTIFLIFTGILAVSLKSIGSDPQMKNLLYVNYPFIIVFIHYLVYLKARIDLQITFIKDIEDRERFPYKAIIRYNSRKKYSLVSTSGLLFVTIIVLIGTNTVILIFL